MIALKVEVCETAEVFEIGYQRELIAREIEISQMRKMAQETRGKPIELIVGEMESTEMNRSRVFQRKGIQMIGSGVEDPEVGEIIQTNGRGEIVEVTVIDIQQSQALVFVETDRVQFIQNNGFDRWRDERSRFVLFHCVVLNKDKGFKRWKEHENRLWENDVFTLSDRQKLQFWERLCNLLSVESRRTRRRRKGMDGFVPLRKKVKESLKVFGGEFVEKQINDRETFEDQLLKVRQQQKT